MKLFPLLPLSFFAKKDIGAIGAKTQSMKNILSIIAIAALLAGCAEEKKPKPKDGKSLFDMPEQTQVELGFELYDGAGNCFACHKPDQKIIAPSLQEIAQIYKEKNGDMVAFLKEEAPPIVDPDQYETMKTNFSITKSMTDEELKALEAYIYSTLEK